MYIEVYEHLTESDISRPSDKELVISISGVRKRLEPSELGMSFKDVDFMDRIFLRNLIINFHEDELWKFSFVKEVVIEKCNFFGMADVDNTIGGALLFNCCPRVSIRRCKFNNIITPQDRNSGFSFGVPLIEINAASESVVLSLNEFEDCCRFKSSSIDRSLDRLPRNFRESGNPAPNLCSVYAYKNDVDIETRDNRFLCCGGCGTGFEDYINLQMEKTRELVDGPVKDILNFFEDVDIGDEKDDEEE